MFAFSCISIKKNSVNLNVRERFLSRFFLDQPTTIGRSGEGRGGGGRSDGGGGGPAGARGGAEEAGRRPGSGGHWSRIVL